VQASTNSAPQSLPRAVICSSGSPALDRVSEILQQKGHEVVIIFDTSVVAPIAVTAQYCLHCDLERPEAAGLVSRISSASVICIDGWGLDEELVEVPNRLIISYLPDFPEMPATDAVSLLLAVAAGNETTWLPATTTKPRGNYNIHRTADTSKALERLGLDSSQIAHLAAERVI